MLLKELMSESRFSCVGVTFERISSRRSGWVQARNIAISEALELSGVVHILAVA